MKLSGYDFYMNLDCCGSTIKVIPDKDVSSLKQIADSMPDCLGFNTLGHLKGKICDKEDFIMFNNEYNVIDEPNSSGGLYVKIIKKRDFRYKILCVNLLRRPDRKNNMINKFKQSGIMEFEFFEAVDGSKLEPTEEIRKLFLGNDFNYRKNYTGCNLSQYMIYQQLIADPVNDFYIIFEDDIVDMDNNYISRLDQLISQFQYGLPDIVFLGYLMNDNNLAKHGHLYNKSDNPELVLNPFRGDLFFGGMHNYIISKNGANKILNYAETNHITRAIDWFATIVPDIVIYECRPHIAFAEWVKSYDSTVDSDIQRNFDSLYFNTEMDNYTFYPYLDSYGYDIKYVGGKTPLELKELCEADEKCIGFNTLGYFKHYISDNMKPCKYFKRPDEGLYVHKNR